MQAPAVGKPLELVPAAEVELHLRDRPDQLAHDLGDEDLAAFRLARYARRDVDRRAEDIAAFLHDLAGVEADPDAQLALWILLAVLGDRLLDVKRALDTMPGGSEADHETIAEAFDPAAGV